MIYRHKRSGLLYRFILRSFSVERQAHSVVYMSLDSGQIFDRDADKFEENFDYNQNSQLAIVPKDPHP